MSVLPCLYKTGFLSRKAAASIACQRASPPLFSRGVSLPAMPRLVARRFFPPLLLSFFFATVYFLSAEAFIFFNGHLEYHHLTAVFDKLCVLGLILVVIGLRPGFRDYVMVFPHGQQSRKINFTYNNTKKFLMEICSVKFFACNLNFGH